jgi:catalase
MTSPQEFHHSNNPMAKRQALIKTAGAPVAESLNSITAGPRGPLLVEGYPLIEKLARRNRERIPQRTVHAKRWGAFGTITISDNISNYTTSSLVGPGAVQERRHDARHPPIDNGPTA